MFTSGLYTVIASATTEHQSDIISNPASRQVAAAEFKKFGLFAYRSIHELITTALLKIRTKHQWTHTHFRQVLQDKHDLNHYYYGYSSWEAHEFCGL